MAAKKRRSSKSKTSKRKDETAALKKIAAALPTWILICILTMGICFGVMMETGVVKLSHIQEFLGFTLFDDILHAESSDTGGITLTDDMKRFGVYVIDVGQGDSVFINANGKTVLIDAGEEGEGRKVCAFLREHDVEKLDYVIATHPHSDHIGGMDDVIKNFGGDKIIVPRLPDKYVPTTVCYENFLKAVRDRKLKLTAARKGNRYSLGSIDGDEIYMTILTPVSDKEYENLNDYSVVVRIDYGKISWLFTGDMSDKLEKDLINSGADVDVTALKVGHHGSATSSSSRFLKQVTPSMCVISCGAGNSYGHPTDSALNRLSSQTDKIYRTDLDGTIAVFSDGENLYPMRERTR